MRTRIVGIMVTAIEHACEAGEHEILSFGPVLATGEQYSRYLKGRLAFWGFETEFERSCTYFNCHLPLR